MKSCGRHIGRHIYGSTLDQVFWLVWLHQGTTWTNMDHISCHEINMSRYQRMQDPEVNWKCYKCSSAFSDIYQPLYSSQCISAQHITSSTVSLNLSNESPVTFRPNTASIPILNGGDIANHTPSSASLHSAPSALYGSYILSHGSPITPDVSDLKSKAKNCWRTVVLNANSVVGPKKSADLASLTDYTRPDALTITETKTDVTISNNPFPEGYNTIRMDRKLGAGGSAICVRDCYTAVEVQLSNKRDDRESVWVHVSLLKGRKLFINSFYRQHSGDAREQVKFYNNELSEISKIASSRDHIILGGDYNFKDIDWTNCSTQLGSVNRLACDDFLESLAEHSLVQLNSEATREKSILDLYFTNRPSLARHIAAVLGVSDHDCAILADTYLSPVINSTPAWRVWVWSQANWARMRGKVQAFATDFLAEYLSCSVDQNWQRIEDCQIRPWQNAYQHVKLPPEKITDRGSIVSSAEKSVAKPGSTKRLGNLRGQRTGYTIRRSGNNAPKKHWKLKTIMLMKKLWMIWSTGIPNLSGDLLSTCNLTL